jgi:hypothetical protein
LEGTPVNGRGPPPARRRSKPVRTCLPGRVISYCLSWIEEALLRDEVHARPASCPQGT